MRRSDGPFYIHQLSPTYSANICIYLAHSRAPNINLESTTGPTSTPSSTSEITSISTTTRSVASRLQSRPPLQQTQRGINICQHYNEGRKGHTDKLSVQQCAPACPHVVNNTLHTTTKQQRAKTKAVPKGRTRTTVLSRRRRRQPSHPPDPIRHVTGLTDLPTSPQHATGLTDLSTVSPTQSHMPNIQPNNAFNLHQHHANKSPSTRAGPFGHCPCFRDDQTDATD
jgi:hypothetical protein